MANNGSNGSNSSKNKRRHTGRNFIIFLVIVVAALFCVNQYFFPFWNGKGAIIPDRTGYSEEDYFIDKDNVNILVIGSDTLEGDGGRSDSLIFMSCDLNTKKILMISVPRDTRVDIPGKKSKAKINSAYSIGGIDLARQTVENLLRVPIDYYVQTDFAGFEEIVDVLGGIEIDVDKRMYYHTYDGMIDLEKGLQVLNGKDALGYVRFRHDPMGDITRTGRQQTFLKAVLTKMLSADSLLKLPSLIPALNDAIETDMTVKQMTALGTIFKGIDVDNDLYTMTLPGTPQNIGGGSYWIVDPDETVAFVQEQLLTLEQTKSEADDVSGEEETETGTDSGGEAE